MLELMVCGWGSFCTFKLCFIYFVVLLFMLMIWCEYHCIAFTHVILAFFLSLPQGQTETSLKSNQNEEASAENLALHAARALLNDEEELNLVHR